MTTLCGILTKIKRRNYKTGYVEAVLRNGAQIFCVSGIMPNYPVKTPLKIDCIEETADGKVSYYIKNVRMYSESDSDLIPFLCSFSPAFGIGKKEAQKICSHKEGEFFSYLKNLTDYKPYSGKEKRILAHIKEYLHFEDFYEYVRSIEGNYHTANMIFRVHGRYSEQKCRENPYILLTADYPFEMCDKLSSEYGIPSFDKQRVSSVINYALCLSQGNGNTRISFHELCSIIQREENRAKKHHTHPLFIAEAVQNGNYHIEYKEDEVFIYLLEDYINENTIAQNVIRLEKTAVSLGNNMLTVEEVESDCKIAYSKEQKDTFSVLDRSGVKVITGGPGTGKTTLLNGLLHKYKEEHPFFEIVLCSPTGCAARRMQESTGMPAYTIHQLLKIRPFDAKNEIKGAKITADCIIVDECSMIDTFIAARLFSSIKNGALVILLGDIDQIESVGSGRVLKDLIESGFIQVYELKTNYRQGNDNPIIDNAISVSEGNTKLFTTDRFQILRFPSQEAIVEDLKERIPSLLNNNSDCKIFTPSKKRKFAASTSNINKQVQEILKKDDTDSIFYGSNEYHVKDKVIFTRNNHKLGYYNGEEGIITHIHRGTDRIYLVVATDDDTIQVDLSNLDDLDLAYAITAHKSQGSECDHAVIIVPKEPKSLLRRQLLYVEITRAKQNVTILSEKNALEEAISKKHEVIRYTGLKEKLKDRQTR